MAELKHVDLVSFRSLFPITNIQMFVSVEIACIKYFNIVGPHRGTST
jgi:hypothetical protein